MSIKLKGLREERAKLVPQMRKVSDLLHAEKRVMKPEEETQWRSLNADYDRLTQAIEAEKRTDELEKQLAETDGDERVGKGDGKRRPAGDQPLSRALDLAITGWARATTGNEPTEQEEEAAAQLGMALGRRTLTVHLDKRAGYGKAKMVTKDQRAMGVGTTEGGGGLVANTFVGQFEIAQLQHGGLFQACSFIDTDTGGVLPIPTLNDTGNEGEQLGENVESNEQGATGGVVNLHDYKFSSKIIKVSAELLEDSAFDLAPYLAEICGARIGKIANSRATTGSGAGTMAGIVNKATLGVTAASATAITWDELKRLIHSVDAAYRSAAGCGFMFHDSIMLGIRLLKDGVGHDLWQPSPNDSAPDKIMKYPYFINQSMAASIATTAKTVLFGDLKKYTVRRVRQLRLKRLGERFAEKDQEAFVAFQRMDGNLIDAGTHPVKYLQQS